MTTLGGNPRVRVNPSRPEAQAICDLCGVIRNHGDLRFQFEWRGNALVNTYHLVCQDTCYDEPFQLDRPRLLPPDPEPVLNARPPQWALQENENEGPSRGDPDPIQQWIDSGDVP
jgi:hypothetical protein